MAIEDGCGGNWDTRAACWSCPVRCPHKAGWPRVYSGVSWTLLHFSTSHQPSPRRGEGGTRRWVAAGNSCAGDMGLSFFLLCHERYGLKARSHLCPHPWNNNSESCVLSCSKFLIILSQTVRHRFMLWLGFFSITLRYVFDVVHTPTCGKCYCTTSLPY